MMKTRKLTAWITILLLFVLVLAGCGGSAAETCIVSHLQFNDKAELESAAQPGTLEAGKDVYASIYFIESPLGTKYTVKWTIDGDDVKTETQAMKTDRQGMLVFKLEADAVKTGSMVCEILRGEDVLLSKEITVN